MVFFSLPLALPILLQPVLLVLPRPVQSIVKTYLTGSYTPTLPNFTTAALFSIFGLAAVHFNTIIHPYTLADNRHYVFYVFRILIRRPVMKYAAVAVYYICSYLVIRTIGITSSPASTTQKPASIKKVRDSSKAKEGTQISWLIVWILTTALSVITAPLVEPRYFIIPWIMWRLHVPSLPTSTGKQGRKVYDMRLVLETVWSLVVNVGVGYMFLYRGFEWQNEPGKVQRFLW